MTTGTEIVTEAKKHLGKGGSFVWNAVKLGYSGWSWCCGFVTYVFRQCGASKLFCNGQQVVNCYPAQVWLAANCKKVGFTEVQAGDVVIFTWDGKSRSHIGIVVSSIDKNYIQTIEGNTLGSGPTTSKVALRKRSRKTIYGIYRPNYAVEKVTPLMRYIKPADGGNVRKGRGTGYAKVGTLKKNTKLYVYNLISDWYKIYSGDYKGYYIHKSCVDPNRYTSRTYKTLQQITLRSGPGKANKQVGTVSKGTKLKSDYQRGWWAHYPVQPGVRTPCWSCIAAKSGKGKHYLQKVSQLEGMDVSNWQKGKTAKQFKAAKDNGLDFVILRSSYTASSGKLEKDASFESFYKSAKAAGLVVGVYHYSKATTASAAVKEAKFVLSVLNNRTLTYPVYFDLEDPCQSGLGRAKNKEIAEAFCKTIAATGYRAGVYANYNFLVNKIGQIDKKYSIWLAQYPISTYTGRYDIHQHSSSGTVKGFGSKIDVDVSWLEKKNTPAK